MANRQRPGALLSSKDPQKAASLFLLLGCSVALASGSRGSARWSAKPAFVPASRANPLLSPRSRVVGSSTSDVIGLIQARPKGELKISPSIDQHTKSNLTDSLPEITVVPGSDIQDLVDPLTPPFSFPQPPPAPSDKELHREGLPPLVRAAEHASAGRTLLTELPDNGGVDIPYQQALEEAGLVSDYLTKTIGRVDAKENTPLSKSSGEPSKEMATKGTTIHGEFPKTVAHLTLPGSEFIASMWGTWASGRCSVPLAVGQHAPELLHVLNETQPDVILIGGGVDRTEDDDGISIQTKPAKNLPELLEAAEQAGMSDRIVHLSEILQDFDDVLSGEPTSEASYRLGNGGAVPSMDSPALVLFTSGTTGKPKGVLTTHRNIYHQVTDLVWAWGWNPDDLALHLLPLHHAHGLINILCCAAYAGASCEFQPFHCQDLWWTLATESTHDTACGMCKTPTIRRKPNVLMGVPTIYAKLLESAEVLPEDLIQKAVDETLSPMRLMVCGSAALPVSVMERWQDLTGHTLLERYGMTEFVMALSNPYKPEERRLPAHVGLPLPSVEVRIVDENTGETIPPGAKGKGSGELQVKGPTVFREYLNLPEVTKKEFADDGSGFFKTGDIAEFDKSSGTYKILGRASVDIIKNGGHKLSALEIERDLLEHPDIQELVVVGVKDPTWGERVGMICRMHSGCDPITLPDLREWADGRMAKYKVPSRIMVVDFIPKNAMGKVNKKELRLRFRENR